MSAVEVRRRSTGRRNARSARFVTISVAQVRASGVSDGRQMKIFWRLGESPMPVTSNGPRICKRVRRLDSLLAAFERDGARALVALGEAAVHERDGEVVLTGRGVETDLAQSVVDLLDGRIEPLVDRLVIDFAADVRAIELLAVEQHDDGVLELHARHFARERHVADRELVLAVGRKVVLRRTKPPRVPNGMPGR